MSQETKYEDFEVEVRSIAKRKYEVRVLRSPGGRRVQSPFKPPYSTEELGSILSALEGRVCESARVARDMAWVDVGAESMAPLGVRELGRKLFQALFRGDVERSFREAIAVVAERSAAGREVGLRIRVAFDHAEDFAPLATLPWEFLWDGGEFINRRRITPVVRSLNVPQSRLDQVDAPLRVLLIPSDPTDLCRLKTGQETRLVRQALKNNPGIEVVTMRRPSIRKLRSRLREGGFHVLHFMGHGGLYGDGRDDFVLYFEGKGRKSQAVTSMQLAENLCDIQGLQLVVLNSCWSGAVSRHDGQDPFTGVATALISRGMPAVVAMQFPISDSAAITFSRAFYECLVAEDPVSAAVTEARLAILTAEPDSLEWGTPVVFLAGEDFRFDIRKGSQPSPSGTPPARRTGGRAPKEPVPIRLSIQSFKDPYLGDNELPDRPPLVLAEYFNDRYIKDVALWRTEVYPRLAEFLLPYQKARTPLVLDFAAHVTIAFAAGYLLEVKSGLDVTVLQRSQSGVSRWKAEPGPARTGLLWQDEADLVLDSSGAAVAIAVGATHRIVADVNAYLKRSRRAVGRLVPATIYPGPSSTAVEDGQHALQLAQDLSLKIRERSVEERRRPLHLFAAAPNALLFFLGQLARGFGPVQLYEHDFPSGKLGAYLPSLRLPVR